MELISQLLDSLTRLHTVILSLSQKLYTSNIAHVWNENVAANITVRGILSLGVEFGC